jgi:hypothetical protein
LPGWNSCTGRKAGGIEAKKKRKPQSTTLNQTFVGL